MIEYEIIQILPGLYCSMVVCRGCIFIQNSDVVLSISTFPPLFMLIASILASPLTVAYVIDRIFKMVAFLTILNRDQGG